MTCKDLSFDEIFSGFNHSLDLVRIEGKINSSKRWELIFYQAQGLLQVKTEATIFWSAENKIVISNTAAKVISFPVLNT